MRRSWVHTHSGLSASPGQTAADRSASWSTTNSLLRSGQPHAYSDSLAIRARGTTSHDSQPIESRPIEHALAGGQALPPAPSGATGGEMCSGSAGQAGPRRLHLAQVTSGSLGGVRCRRRAVRGSLFSQKADHSPITGACKVVVPGGVVRTLLNSDLRAAEDLCEVAVHNQPIESRPIEHARSGNRGYFVPIGAGATVAPISTWRWGSSHGWLLAPPSGSPQRTETRVPGLAYSGSTTASESIARSFQLKPV